MLIIYLIIGVIAGIMSGLFGIGGGIVVIPALSNTFTYYTAIPAQHIMQMAVGTSLAIMISTSTSALYAHHKRNAVRWQMFRAMLPGLIIGAIAGALIAHLLPSTDLQISFGIFLVIIGFRMLTNKQETQSANGPLSNKIIYSASLLIGVLSSLLGVGGGTLIVPFLLRTGMDMREATGTSVACGLAVGIAATICFMITGLFSSLHLPWSTGYIYWPAFIGVAIASTLFAPLGAMLAHKLPKLLLQRIFGCLLLLVACDMLFLK